MFSYELLKNLKLAISKSSPLYHYWKTSQDDFEENKRLLISNQDSRFSKLFRDEPYKWENLFQSIAIEIYNGDIQAIKAFTIVLDTIKREEREKVFFRLKEFSVFDQSTIELIRNNKHAEMSNRKIFRFIRILFAIFTNPYDINLKRKKSHLYEITGSIINKLRND